MKISREDLEKHREAGLDRHIKMLAVLLDDLDSRGINGESIITNLAGFQVAIPSWALGAGATRFGRFAQGGEPGNLFEKIADIAILNDLTGSAGSVSLHIPWDVPKDIPALLQWAEACGIGFDAVNSNTFQDHPGQEHSYRFGSLSHANPRVREQAIDHHREVIGYGKSLGSKSITVWLADGSTFPGQQNFRKALERTQDSLLAITAYLPPDWRMFIEYKPYEPQFYSTVIQDWGTSLLLAEACRPKAFTLVDLGHHLPNTNIEQIVASLLWQGKLGGFHFNDSKYGDDDLTAGSIKPYQLFLIFLEIVQGLTASGGKNPPLSFMIDASHNIKDPLEDLLQSLEAMQLAFAQALAVDTLRLDHLQEVQDVVQVQELLQDAFRTDLRPLLREARLRTGAALEPLQLYRDVNVRRQLITERGMNQRASGL